jgi:DsbC/DsbD-like thiol-disulfide interchange protein
MRRGIQVAAAAIAAAAGITAPAVDTIAQGRPRAEVSIVGNTDTVHAGRTTRLALRVALPDGVHVQSNAPRDPLLIATAVTVVPPSGVTVEQIVYPPATDFTQAGQSTPLAVFEQRFAVGVELALAGGVTPGELQVPVRLRYQACDRTTCFAPLREEVTATLRVVADGVKSNPLFTELLDRLPFRR